MKKTIVERFRIGAYEVQVAVTGDRLLPTADVPSCSSSCSSSSNKGKR
jgi:hypothetical protein